MASVAPAPHPHAGLPSAFAAAAAAGWDTPSAHTTATATPATGSDGGSVHSGLWPSRTPSGALEHARSAPLQPKRSLGLQRVTSDPTSQLWRTSTAVTERAASLGFTSVESLCGSAYVPAARLSKFKPLGEGAFAEVESALLAAPEGSAACTLVKQPVAVKRLKPHALESEDDVVSFIQEARMLSRLRHPSIVGFIGLGTSDSSCPEAAWRTMFLVQEYATGGTLKRLILSQMINPTRKLYSLADAVRWAGQVAEGLAYLHAANPMILHRDLKSENVLLAKDEQGQQQAKLADFGLHKLVPAKKRPERELSHISEEGAPCSPTAADGTYELTGRTGAYVYMAPEVLLGSQYNEKVDVFSFGMVLYELLHRRMVVADLMYLGSAEDAEAFAYKVAAGYRLPIGDEVPAPLAKLVSECLAGRPEDRPSMAEVVARLQECAQSGVLEAAEHMHGPRGPAAGCCTLM